MNDVMILKITSINSISTKEPASLLLSFSTNKDLFQKSLIKSLNLFRNMSALSASVNVLYSELENFANKVRYSDLSTPKFITEVERLKGEIHRLHWDAHHVDELIRISRFRPVDQIREIDKWIYRLRHELGFAQGQFNDFVRLDRKPPVCRSIFSSPSNSYVSSPPGSPPGRWGPFPTTIITSPTSNYAINQGWYPSNNSQQSYSSSHGTAPYAFGSQGSQSFGFGSQGTSYGGGFGSQGYPSLTTNQNITRFRN